MKVSEALELLGGSKADLARALGVTRQAVSRWGEEMPFLRELHLRKVLSDKPK